MTNKHKRLFYIFYLVIAFLCTTELHAQNEKYEQDVIEEITTFFKGLNAKDTTLIKTTLAKEVSLRSVLIKNEDKILVTDSISSFLRQIGMLPTDLIIYEKVSNTKVNIRFPMASVFTDYEFFINNEKSHSGINFFTLVYLDDAWKIVSIMDTRE